MILSSEELWSSLIHMFHFWVSNELNEVFQTIFVHFYMAMVVFRVWFFSITFYWCSSSNIATSLVLLFFTTEIESRTLFITITNDWALINIFGFMSKYQFIVSDCWVFWFQCKACPIVLLVVCIVVSFSKVHVLWCHFPQSKVFPCCKSESVNRSLINYS